MSMNGRTAAARVPGAERVDGITYKVPLRNGQNITIPSPPRVYYTAAGVARIKEELDSNMSHAMSHVPDEITNKLLYVPTTQTDNGVQIFQSPEFGQIRAIEVNGEPWLVGKDVATALGYSDAYGALRKHVDTEDKQNCQNDSFETPRGMTIINESGLYSLILSSKLPSAKKFKHWITSEVIPSIRKHGVYMTSDTLDQMIASPEFGIKLLTALRDERDKNKALTARIEADQPKVEFADHISGYKGTISVGSLAKLLSKNGITIGRNKLYRWMRDEKILNQDNIPYQKYMDTGYFTVIKELRTVSKSSDCP